MKQVLILSFIVLGELSLHAQSLQEAKEHIYYQRYNSASGILRSMIKKIRVTRKPGICSRGVI
jgi:Tfp pilus assembly protein PilV